ncbi:MAG: 50S ribosomal protein L25/general stress protein Ctc [Frankiaceae bacterium]
MSEVRMSAELRTEFGKGAARRTRRAGKVPAVLYGHGQDPRHIALPARELGHALRGGANVLLSLEVNGGTELALPKDVQRDPLRRTVDHVDLLLVRRGEKIAVEVPLSLTGDAPTTTLVDQQQMTLSVEAEATTIPPGFEISIDGLEVGQSVTAGEVALPQGVTLLGDAELVLVQGLASPTAEELEGAVEGEAAGAPAEAAAGAGAGEGAPLAAESGAGGASSGEGA